jgi:ADP-heptose:LPS heptosyltransferase
LSPPSNPKERPAEESILVIRFSSLGDLLLTAAALRGLRTRFPLHRIDLLVADNYVATARLLPGVDSVIGFDRQSGMRGLLRLRRDLSRRYTVLVDLQNNIRSVFLRLFTFPAFWVKAKRYRFRRWLLVHFKWNVYRAPRAVALRYLDALAMFGIEDDGRGLELMLPADKITTDRAPDEHFIALCPGARHFTKRWPAERWIETGCKLHGAGYRILVIGAQNETELLLEITDKIPHAQAICGLTIPEVAALFRQVQVVVSNDSGLMHLAAGVRTPLVALFGPTVEEFGFYPFRANGEILAHPLPCRPCSAMGSENCPKGHFRCMLDTRADEVCRLVERLAQSKKM